ncbi:methionine adenosyltransferase 2 subunit beta [Exaiptasia diaphana]|uniref:Methionine adenosyltransferase 2 subunit beta n=1 Tax=Exaiptasia diaphana TaxID=2652724 RepID=A0A913XGV5_EXADI|nr:methionine adenosyltransferase 2 subunit beta [Exaiptasia diaphana]
MSSCRRVLVIFLSGLLGRALMKVFSNVPGWEVLGLAHSRVSGTLKKVDLLNFEETKKIVEEFKPHVLIHFFFERRPDVVSNNPDGAEKLNVGTTEFLANLVESFNKGLEIFFHSMLYISTDYVFDGTKPPYEPDDPPHPLNKYGESKLAVFLAVMRCQKSCLILRVPVLYGEVEYLGESAVSVLLTAIQDTKKKTTVDDYQLRFPTLVDDVANVVLFMAKRKSELETFSGIFHWSNDEQMTKYMMASKFF